MNLIKKFKDFVGFISGVKSTMKWNKWLTLDLEELQNICQELFDDFRFNADNGGKIKIGFSEKELQFVQTIFNRMIEGGKNWEKIPFPLVNRDRPFKLGFNRNNEIAGRTEEITEFCSAIEEIIDRIESTFPFEIVDENVQSNRIVRNEKGELCWKMNPGSKDDGGYHSMNTTYVWDDFWIAFKLKDGYEGNLISDYKK